MLPRNLPQYTVRELESRAAELLTQHYGADLKAPIDVEFLLETVPRVDLDVWRGLRDNHYLDGVVLRDPGTGQFLVIIDEWLADQQPNRYRMTVAEELGHVVLHQEIIEKIRSIDEFQELQNHPEYERVERNAKRFAAAVLMPGQLVLPEAELLYARLVQVAGFGNRDAVKNHLCAQLAKHFEVSFAAMNIRLGEWPTRVYERVDDSMEAQLAYLA